MRFLKTILDSFLYSKVFLISLSKTEVPPSSVFCPIYPTYLDCGNMSESLEANSKQMNDQIGDLNEIERDQSNDFPGRPYMSVQEAIKSKDFEAIQPFIKSNGFNPNQQTMPQHKRYTLRI